MKKKSLIVCSLGLALALSSCATRHGQANGAAAQGNTPAVRTCQAPASIVGKTLHIDARKASYEFKLDVPADEYADWRENAVDYVSRTNSFDYSFRSGGKLKGHANWSYVYKLQGGDGGIVIYPGEGSETILLCFVTPTSGIAHVRVDGAIGSEFDNSIYMLNMPFVLK